MNKLHLIIALLICSQLVSCMSEDKKKTAIAESKLPPMELEIKRYGKALFELDTSDLKNGLKGIQQEYIYFLDADLDNKQHIDQMYAFVSDTQLISIYQKSMDVYPDLDKLEAEISTGFRHFKYYFPEWDAPNVYTYISGMFHENPVILSDSVMIIALDVYLGKDFTPYRSLGLPNYKIRCMEADYIATNVMTSLFYQHLAKPHRSLTLLEKMLDGGKLLYYLDAVLPETPDSVKIRYTENQINWVKQYEKDVWAFLIENRLLFGTDSKEHNKLIEDGPFTAGFSNDSPPRIGLWVGWQIISDFMAKNPELGLRELMAFQDAQELLRLSEYKPLN